MIKIIGLLQIKVGAGRSSTRKSGCKPLSRTAQSQTSSPSCLKKKLNEYLILLSIVLLAGCNPPSYESKLDEYEIRECRLASNYCACVGAMAMQHEIDGTHNDQSWIGFLRAIQKETNRTLTTEQLNWIRSNAITECENKNRDDKEGWSTGVNIKLAGYFLSLFLRLGQTIND